MMADSVEAASRSLPEYTEESINNLVEKIIDSQVEEGFFKECPITFKDIAIVKSVFKEKLKTIYHTRISYPELKNKRYENNRTRPETYRKPATTQRYPATRHQSFSFMKRFHEVPRKSNLKVKDKYGAGILTLRLKQGIQRAFMSIRFKSRHLLSAI